MKLLKLLSCLFVLQVLLMITVLPLGGEAPVSTGVQTEEQSEDSTIESFIKLAGEYREAGNFKEALKQLNIATKKFPQKKYREKLQIERADVHFLWAFSLKEKYDYANAIKHFKMVYAINKNNRPGYAAYGLLGIGSLYDDLAQKQKALEYYEKALAIFQDVGDRAGEAATLNNIGLVYEALGQKKKALAYYEKALSISKAVGDRAGEAATLNNIGLVYDAKSKKPCNIMRKHYLSRKQWGTVSRKRKS
jgi:tetratricopeptide (TPR) repeat protein